MRPPRAGDPWPSPVSVRGCRRSCGWGPYWSSPGRSYSSPLRRCGAGRPGSRPFQAAPVRVVPLFFPPGGCAPPRYRGCFAARGSRLGPRGYRLVDNRERHHGERHHGERREGDPHEGTGRCVGHGGPRRTAGRAGRRRQPAPQRRLGRPASPVECHMDESSRDGEPDRAADRAPASVGRRSSGHNGPCCSDANGHDPHAEPDPGALDERQRSSAPDPGGRHEGGGRQHSFHRPDVRRFPPTHIEHPPATWSPPSSISA